mgnify:CR=1 FL=1
MIRNRRIVAQRFVEPNLVGASRLTVKPQAEFLEPFDDVAVTIAGEPSHQVATTSG